MLIRASLTATAVALMLAACGGGDDYEKLVSFGDSLSDVGTHKVGSIAGLAAATGGGGRWTTNSPEGGEIWTERLAAQIGVAKPCAAETGLSPNIVDSSGNPALVGAPTTGHPGCYSYAQGSARVTSPLGPNSIALQQNPFNQTTLGLIAKPLANQMDDHLTATGGYSGNELVTVLAGANDVFMELSLTAPSNQSTAVNNVANAGAALGQLIKTQIVAKGAKRVLVLNIPDVAGTPFAKSLDLTQPGTTLLIDTMVKQFNAQLAAQLLGVPEVHLADAYNVSKDQLANPAQYGLVNVTDVACGPNALSSPTTANGTSLVCNARNTRVADVSRYQFADDVHPTAYGHLLLAQFAAKELLKAGWL